MTISKYKAKKACKKLQATINNDDKNTQLINSIKAGINMGEEDYVVFVYIKPNSLTPSEVSKQFPPEIDGVRVEVVFLRTDKFHYQNIQD